MKNGNWLVKFMTTSIKETFKNLYSSKIWLSIPVNEKRSELFACGMLSAAIWFSFGRFLSVVLSWPITSVLIPTSIVSISTIFSSSSTHLALKAKMSTSVNGELSGGMKSSKKRFGKRFLKPARIGSTRVFVCFRVPKRFVFPRFFFRVGIYYQDRRFRAQETLSLPLQDVQRFWQILFFRERYIFIKPKNHNSNNSHLEKKRNLSEGVAKTP